MYLLIIILVFIIINLNLTVFILYKLNDKQDIINNDKIEAKPIKTKQIKEEMSDLDIALQNINNYPYNQIEIK